MFAFHIISSAESANGRRIERKRGRTGARTGRMGRGQLAAAEDCLQLNEQRDMKAARRAKMRAANAYLCAAPQIQSLLRAVHWSGTAFHLNGGARFSAAAAAINDSQQQCQRQTLMPAATGRHTCEARPNLYNLCAAKRERCTQSTGQSV